MTRFAIVSSTGRAGFVLRRRHEFEAFDADEQSLGTFETEDGAWRPSLKGLRRPMLSRRVSNWLRRLFRRRPFHYSKPSGEWRWWG